MTPPTVPPTPQLSDPVGGDGEVLAGLVRDLDALRHTVEPLTGVSDRVDQVADLITQLSHQVAAITAKRSPTPAPSWLLAPTDPGMVGQLLDELIAWLHAVYLRYTDAGPSLPECWLWHADVVEELLWLEHAWLAAYQGPNASVALVGDWHDRQRPGVVRRVKGYAGTCSRENHQTRPGWTTVPKGALPVPGVDHALSIADWWAHQRDEPAPEPPLRAVDATGRDGVRW